MSSSLFRSTPEKENVNMSVDDRELTDWANLSYDEVISSTMAQSRIKKSFTPLRRKKATSKNLSHSFSILSADIDIDNNVGGGGSSGSDGQTTQRATNFYRSDSGFNEGDNFNTNDQMMDISMHSNF